MSTGKKSVIVLGNGGGLKKALVTHILGKDLSRVHYQRILRETDVYEEDTYRFMCAPDLSTDSEDIRKLLTSSPRPDMNLLVVERGFSTEQVWGQIEQLAHRTGRGTDEFVVVLPLACKTGDYPFKSRTLEDLIMNLNEHRNSKPPYKRYGPDFCRAHFNLKGKHRIYSVSPSKFQVRGTSRAQTSSARNGGDR